MVFDEFLEIFNFERKTILKALLVIGLALWLFNFGGLHWLGADRLILGAGDKALGVAGLDDKWQLWREPTPQPTPAPAATPSPTPEPSATPRPLTEEEYAGHPGVRIIDVGKGKLALIDVNKYLDTGGEIMLVPESWIDRGEGELYAMTCLYIWQGKSYSWQEVQGYYSRKYGCIVTSLKDDKGLAWDVLGGEVDWIRAGRPL